MLLEGPQRDFQAELSIRLERMGFPALRPTHVQLLNAITPEAVRLAELVTLVGLPKQTVGGLIDDLEQMTMVERFPDPERSGSKRVRLGPKGKQWAAEVRRAGAATEALWGHRLGSRKMKSLRALLHELASTVEEPAIASVNGVRRAKRG